MAKEKNQKSIEETLWESANKPRGSVESSEYKHIVLGLIFLKFVSNAFEEQRKRLSKKGKAAFLSKIQTIKDGETMCKKENISISNIKATI